MRDANPSDSDGPSPLNLPESAAKAFLDVDYWNPGGLTLFGGPWEARAHGAFLLLRKGGNLPGYTALFSFLPELRLAAAATWNGGIDEFVSSERLWAPLLGETSPGTGFPAALAAIQPDPAPPGPHPADYVGSYESTPPGLPAFVVFNATGRGRLLFEIPGNFGVFLADAAGILPGVTDAFRVSLGRATLPCLEGELLGFEGNWVFFTRAKGGNVSGVSAPGIVPGVSWHKA